MIASVHLTRGELTTDFRWGKLERETLQLVLRNGVMKREDVLRHVEARIVVLGIDNALQSDRHKISAGAVTSPHALAFALQRDRIPVGVRDLILFDEGDAADNFMRNHVDDLPERIIKQLLGTTPSAICNEN
jgi:hypothetical protein